MTVRLYVCHRLHHAAAHSPLGLVPLPLRLLFLPLRTEHEKGDDTQEQGQRSDTTDCYPSNGSCREGRALSRLSPPPTRRCWG